MANWLIALLPVLAMLILFEWLDVFHLLGLREFSSLIGLGMLAGLAAYGVSGRLLDTLPLGFSTYSRFVAPWIEEAIKAVAVLIIFVRNRVGFKLDAVISGFAIGGGFSLSENVIYLLEFGQLPFGVWMVRGLGTAMMHGATSVLFASLAHQFNEREAQIPGLRWRWHPWHYAPGYLAAVMVHTAYNQFPDRPQLAMLTTLAAVPVLVVLIFEFGVTEADHWLDDETACHQDALAELRQGRYPDTVAGQMTAALADRMAGRAPPDAVRALYEVRIDIALRAEALLRSKTSGDKRTVDDSDVEQLNRLERLEAQLGATMVALLTPLLPFTRQEWWEMDKFGAMVRRHRPAHQITSLRST